MGETRPAYILEGDTGDWEVVIGLEVIGVGQIEFGQNLFVALLGNLGGFGVFLCLSDGRMLCRGFGFDRGAAAAPKILAAHASLRLRRREGVL